MASQGRLPYEHHGGFYRGLAQGDDLTKPWEWSPVSNHFPPLSPLKPVFELPRATPTSPVSTSTSPTISISRFPVRKRGVWARIKRFIRSGKLSINEEMIIPAYESVEPELTSIPKVEPHEWKQYGYWARPIIDDLVCVNSPVTSENSIRTEDLSTLIRSMRGPGPDDYHHERWIPGIKHPSLPPRPSRWKDPVPGEPLPFPWEVQINPFLQHILWGPSPLNWCLSAHPTGGTYYGRGRGQHSEKCTGPDRAQPATWPFLTHMYFNAVAGDTAPRFPWPFTVSNPRGIKVGDVLLEIYTAFNTPVTEDEKSSWPMMRQNAADRALRHRCEMLSGYQPFEDIMRRCDALGGVMYFRGIEPTIDGKGWMITFGTH